MWPPTWLRSPSTAGETVSGRPILNLSFALNYALGENEVTGYRLLNVLIHASAAVLLFGIVRRTPKLARERGYKDHESTTPSAFFLPLTVALLWALHPLQTAAVTYVVQRAEALAGLFFLATLYAFIRGAERQNNAAPETNQPQKNRRKGQVPGKASSNSGKSCWGIGPQAWFVISFVACLLGAGTKETIVAAPVVVLLYDRTFLAGSFRAAWQARGRIYGALAATWLLLAVLVTLNHGRGGSAGVGGEIGIWSYTLTQCYAIVRYLGLVVWPVGQIFDYGVPTVAGFGGVWWQSLFLTGLIAGAIWALVRNRPVGFLAVCFFLVLAPSSSVVPIATQTVAEHRMYLALAVPILLIVMAGKKFAVFFSGKAGRTENSKPTASDKENKSKSLSALSGPAGWIFQGIVLAAIVTLATATITRNKVYGSELALWNDTVTKRPDNARAHHNLGIALLRQGRTDEALQEFQRTITLRPNHAFAHFQIGTIWLTKRQWAESVPYFEAALAADPHFLDARMNLGQALNGLGRGDEAVAQYRAVLAEDTDAHDARTSLAALLLAGGQIKEAEIALREVLSADPDFAEAHYQLGLVLEKKGDVTGAEREFNTAIHLKPTLAQAHLALANRRAAQGNSAEAERGYRESLRLDSDSAEAHFGLGNLLAQRRDFMSAISEYNATLTLSPNHIQARNNLANCQLMTGQITEAVSNYESVARARPNDPAVRQNLELARELARGR
ncbi:MAG: tetratricopeptide repeat protein [Nibricoccus sp.]